MNFLKITSLFMLSIALNFCTGSVSAMEVPCALQANGGEGTEGREGGAETLIAQPPRRLTPTKRAIMLFVARAQQDERELRIRCEQIVQYIQEERAISSKAHLERAAKAAASGGAVLAREGFEALKGCKDWVCSKYRRVRVLNATEIETPVVAVTPDERAAMVAQTLAKKRAHLVKDTREILFAADLSCEQLRELCNDILRIPDTLAQG